MKKPDRPEIWGVYWVSLIEPNNPNDGPWWQILEWIPRGAFGGLEEGWHTYVSQKPVSPNEVKEVGPEILPPEG